MGARIARADYAVHRETLSNGTVIEVGDGYCKTTLPNGAVVLAYPNQDSPRMAQELGYGDDTGLMTEDHDPLHSRLADWLGFEYSYALMAAARQRADDHIAGLEEAAVLTIQRLINAVRRSQETA